jgi:hypothetical protein
MGVDPIPPDLRLFALQGIYFWSPTVLRFEPEADLCFPNSSAVTLFYFSNQILKIH